MVQIEVAFKIEKLEYGQYATVTQAYSNISYMCEEIPFFTLLFKHSALTV
jgi:hypothetical protein